MDFLKSAVASAIAKGPSFGYSFGDRVDIDNSIWTLHNGTKKEDGSKCSVFSFDITANKSRLPLARNALRKLRTLRHPGVIKVLDTVETESYIYIATERLIPLGWHTRRKSLAEETIKWGLHGIAKTLKFINDDATSVHGAVRVPSIFTSESGEWKLGGFELLSSMKEDDAVIYSYGSLVPDSNRYAPPEVSKGGWEALKRNAVHCVDAYQFGILVYEAFNGGYMGSDQLPQARSIPTPMQQSYKRLIAQNPKARISVGQFLEQGQRHGGFFQTPLIQLTEDIESLGLKADSEKDEFLNQLDSVSDDFPEEFFKMKVLPELLKSVEFGGGGAKVFSVVMKISAKLSDDEYDAQITPVIIRLFHSPDRALRVCLLDNLPLMIDHLSGKLVNDKMFPQLVTGFTDIAPVVREQTVKSILVIVPKLSDRVINGELLRYLAKTANDEQPGIRTNTTICLGKIARNLGTSSRVKVLIAAFSRSLRDPFVHARNAGLMALGATADLFSEDDCATKLLPAVCTALIDKEKLVRDSANKTLDMLLHRVRKYQSSLPDSVIPPSTASGGAAAANAPRMGTPQTDSSGWAGWAISSFTNKLANATGEMSSDSPSGNPGLTVVPNGTTDPTRSSSVPPSINTAKAASGGGSGGMQLNRTATANATKASTPTSNPFASARTSWEDNPAEPEEEDFGAEWGDAEEDADPFSSNKKTNKNNNDDFNDIADEWGANDDDDDAWGEPSRKSISSNKKKSTEVSYDDGGEPDFAGWLAAQSNKAKSNKKPMPKGLTKTQGTNARPGAVKSNSTPAIGTKKTVTARPKAAPKPEPKKEEPKVEEEEDWGDAWA